MDKDLAAWNNRYDEECGMPWSIFSGPGYHSTMKPGSRVHDVRDSLDYALALLSENSAASVERANRVISRVLTLQETDPTRSTYGIWPWLLEEPLEKMSPPDWNWADFCGMRLARAIHDHSPALDANLILRLRESLGHAAWSIFRRNVAPDYTNIAIMGAGVTMAAGELLDEPRLLDYGRRRLQNMVAYTHYHGEFNEYNSPTYTVVALDELENILDLVKDSTARQEAETLRIVAWRIIADHYHPGTGQWAGPHSRCYQDRVSPDLFPRLLARPNSCPSELRERFASLPESEMQIRRRFIRRIPEDKSVVGITWFSEEACLGSVNCDTLWHQRRPLIGYWRTATNLPVAVFRIRFLHDGKDFASALLRTVQNGPRVLTAVNFVTDAGDFHPSLDRPANECFTVSDLRVRLELAAEDAKASKMQDGRFGLTSGNHSAIIYTLPGTVSGAPITWDLMEEPAKVSLDARIYSGPPKELKIATLSDVVIAAAVEIVPATQNHFSPLPVLKLMPEEKLSLTWDVADGMELIAPTRPGR